MSKKLLSPAIYSVLTAIVFSFVFGGSIVFAGVNPISNLKATPAVFNPVDVKTTVSFKLGHDSTVSAYVEDFSHTVIHVFVNSGDDFLPAGEYSYDWYAKDGNTVDGAVLADGNYTAKVLANGGGSQYFSAVNMKVTSGEDIEDVDLNEVQEVKPAYVCEETPYKDMADVNTKDLCNAIKFVTERGIFSGNPDGTFKPYSYINRAEALRVIFNAYNIPVMPSDGKTTLGFKDLKPNAWYMQYVNTASIQGILQGYDETKKVRYSRYSRKYYTVRYRVAKMEQTVNRAELLKLVLEVSNPITGYVIPAQRDVNFEDVDYDDWFSGYAGVAYTYGLFDEDPMAVEPRDAGKYLHPDRAVYRGEVALMLYRLWKADLMK